jgi:hypothetical protein
MRKRNLRLGPLSTGRMVCRPARRTGTGSSVSIRTLAGARACGCPRADGGVKPEADASATHGGTSSHPGELPPARACSRL